MPRSAMDAPVHLFYATFLIWQLRRLFPYGNKNGDFAYAMSTLRNTRTQTVLIYNSDTRSIVNTNLIEATDVAIGLPFSGDASEAADANDDGAASIAPSGASTSRSTVSPSAARTLLSMLGRELSLTETRTCNRGSICALRPVRAP